MIATRLAIFDLDGTLLDTVRDLGNATNHALGMCGLPQRPLQDYYHLVGRGIYNLFRQAMPAPDEGMVGKMASFFIPYYDAHKCDCTKPYDGIGEMLERLSDRGVLLAVASNKYQAATEELVRRFFPERTFLKILGQREGQPIKPDPRIVRQVMEAAPGVALDEVAYIGDSDVDMQTGINAGVRTIGVSWGFRGRQELETYHPSAIVDTPAALAEEILRVMKNP